MTTGKKLYTAERRLMGASGASMASTNVAPVQSTGGADLSQVLTAIDALRADVEKAISTGATLAPKSTEPEPGPSEDAALRNEVALMIRTIARTKSELASIKHPGDDNDRMLTASSELDEIVRATETATQNILAACERIDFALKDYEAIAARGASTADVVHFTEMVANQVVNIIEACSFQDITGQRVRKVVKTLQFIRERIASMIEIWGRENFIDLPVAAKPDDESHEEAGLLNGPQMDGAGLSQADIDALFD